MQTTQKKVLRWIELPRCVDVHQKKTCDSNVKSRISHRCLGKYQILDDLQQYGLLDSPTYVLLNRGQLADRDIGENKA